MTHHHAVRDEANEIRGVAVVGRPVSRMADDGLTLEVNRLASDGLTLEVNRLASDGLTLEVNRLASDGCPNACSALYGAARRAAFALGYKRLITYTLPEEGGASLRGAGWRLIGLMLWALGVAAASFVAAWGMR